MKYMVFNQFNELVKLKEESLIDVIQLFLGLTENF